MEVSAQIKKAYEQLLSNQEFVNDIVSYTLSALQTLFSLPQTTEVSCPPPYLFVVNNALQSSQNMQNFINSLPGQSRQQINKLIAELKEEKEDAQVDNTFFKNLCDVRWQMTIQNGRQVYEVQLFCQQNEKPFSMRLSYEQLSILTFQVNQIVSTLNKKMQTL